MMLPSPSDVSLAATTPCWLQLQYSGRSASVQTGHCSTPKF